MAREETITDNLEEFLAVLPPPAAEALARDPRLEDLLEVVLALGRGVPPRMSATACSTARIISSGERCTGFNASVV